MRKVGSMSREVVMSVAVLLVAALAGFLAARLIIKRLRAPKAVWLFIALLWIAVFAGILALDVNIPLAESHFSFGGGPAPVSLAILDMFLRFAALASIVFGQSTLRSSFSR
jgi:hypothetical protein